MSEQEKTDDNPRITIDLKIDTADLLKMDIYQRRALDDCLDQIKQINSNGKLGNIAQLIKDNNQKDTNRVERNRYEGIAFVAWGFALTSSGLALTLGFEDPKKYTVEIIVSSIIAVGLYYTGLYALVKMKSFQSKL